MDFLLDFILHIDQYMVMIGVIITPGRMPFCFL